MFCNEKKFNYLAGQFWKWSCFVQNRLQIWSFDEFIRASLNAHDGVGWNIGYGDVNQFQSVWKKMKLQSAMFTFVLQ